MFRSLLITGLALPFSIPHVLDGSVARLVVCDASGRMVRTLIAGRESAGPHEREGWEGLSPRSPKVVRRPGGTPAGLVYWTGFSGNRMGGIIG